MSSLRVLDLFSGMGGFSFGFKQAHYQIDQGLDYWDIACKSFEKHLCSPAKVINLEDYFPSKLDFDIVVIGSSPCQDFSRNNTKRNIFSKRAQLSLDYCRIITALQPEVFVFENVLGLPKWVESAIFDIKGYKITKNILDSQFFGVPQSRRRKIFIGSKKRTISLTKKLSDFTNIITVKEVFKKIKDNWGFSSHNKKTIEKFSHVNSNNWISASQKSDYQGIIRLAWDKPACAITNIKKAQILHPSENRVISLAEALALQDFPSWYIPEGSDTAKAIQIGNAVPPGLSKAIAQEITGRIN